MLLGVIVEIFVLCAVLYSAKAERQKQRADKLRIALLSHNIKFSCICRHFDSRLNRQ